MKSVLIIPTLVSAVLHLCADWISQLITGGGEESLLVIIQEIIRNFNSNPFNQHEGNAKILIFTNIISSQFF
jgi:hypothetical protein